MTQLLRMKAIGIYGYAIVEGNREETVGVHMNVQF